MKLTIPSELRDRFTKIFPFGIPDNMPIGHINALLLRVGLHAVSRFPGLSIEIVLADNVQRTCIHPYCEDPLCRSLHGESPDDIKELHEWCFEPFYDELKDITSRRRTRASALPGRPERIFSIFIGSLSRDFKYRKCNGFFENPRDRLAAAGASYIREMMREQSFARKILPPSFI